MELPEALFIVVLCSYVITVLYYMYPTLNKT